MPLTVDIGKRIGNFALRVRFSAEGETLGILGASGSGKSTTLQCIAGILDPDEGRIVLNGKVLFDSEKRIRVPVARRRIGYLFQQYALFPNMTVEQNIAAGITGCSRAERKARTEEALVRFRLAEKRRQRPATLSGGEQQRTALARIMVGKPDLLLLDEPFSALDGHLKEQLMWELAKTVKEFSGTVLFVSHDREETARFCERVLVLDHGSSEPVRPMRELLADPKTEADAMLAGYFNIAKAYPAENGRIHVPAWGIFLPAGEDAEETDAVCLPEDALVIGREPSPGAVPCRIRGHALRNGKDTLLLCPEGSDTCLMAESVFHGTETNALVWVSVTENRAILLQKNEE